MNDNTSLLNEVTVEGIPASNPISQNPLDNEDYIQNPLDRMRMIYMMKLLKTIL